MTQETSDWSLQPPIQLAASKPDAAAVRAGPAQARQTGATAHLSPPPLPPLDHPPLNLSKFTPQIGIHLNEASYSQIMTMVENSNLLLHLPKTQVNHLLHNVFIHFTSKLNSSHIDNQLTFTLTLDTVIVRGFTQLI